MKEQHKVAIVIPIYNVEKYLEECLESVVGQSYKNLEIILVNDGSTDENSFKIAKEYALKDNRITLFDKENGGLSSARNVGIEYLSGDYELKFEKEEQDFFVFQITNENPLKIHNIYKSKAYFEGKEKELEIPKVDYLEFVDSDDTLSLDNVEECMKRFSQDKNINVVWFQLGFIRNRLNLTDGLILTPAEIFKTLIQNNYGYFWIGWGGGFDFNFLKRIKLKFTNGIIHEDHPFGIKLFAQAKKVAILNKPLYKYRITPISITRGSLSMEKIPHHYSYLKPYFNNGDELKSYFNTMSAFIFHKEIFDFIQNMPDSELKSLMKECFCPYYLKASFLHFKNIREDPLQIHKQALIYTGDNPQDYVIKTFEEASDEEKFRWFQKAANDLQIERDILNFRLSNQISNILKFSTATRRVHNHLPYKLGQIIIRNSKSLWGYIKMPYLLMAMTLVHKEQEKIYKEKIKNNPALALPPLESYRDYAEALKEKQCFTYQLGLALMKAHKNWYKGGYIKFYFEAKALEREFRRGK